MEKFKHILFEYSTLLIIIAMFLIVKLFFYTEMNSQTFAIAIFIIYLRHHHLGSEVEVEEAPHGYFTKSTNRKFLYWLDIPTYVIAFLFILDITSFFLSLLIFILWFILTDFLRVRYTIYGTYISRWFYTSKININNSKWELHNADKDPFPSIPHMHSKNYPLKLNIYTGEIYDTRTKKFITTANKKELKKLWEDEKFKQAVIEARRVYLGEHPKVKLPKIPTFN